MWKEDVIHLLDYFDANSLVKTQRYDNINRKLWKIKLYLVKQVPVEA